MVLAAGVGEVRMAARRLPSLLPRFVSSTLCHAPCLLPSSSIVGPAPRVALFSTQPMGAPRGTHDLYGADLAAHRYIVDTTRQVVSRYAFEEARFHFLPK